MLAASDSSLAGTYQVSACTGVEPLVNNSWARFNSEPVHLETSAYCGTNEITGANSETSGLAAADVLEQSTQTPQGAVAGWAFTAPSGDTISAISMNRDLFENSEGWLPQIVNNTGVALPGESCPYTGTRCELSGAANQAGLDATSLSIEVLCAPTPPLAACGGGSFLHDARAELDGATVTITDEQPPQVTSVSGPLFSGGLVRGTIAGTIDGADNSGVQGARVYVDGIQVAQQAASCDFTRPAPCPTSSSSRLSLDTGTLANGPHTVQAALIDAAGNKTLSAPDEITVDNADPGAPTALQVNGRGSGAWINQPATIAWTNPSQPPVDPIAQINWLACPGADTSIPAGGCDAAHAQTSPLTSLTFAPTLDPVFASRPQGLYTVFVWAQDAIGNTSPADAAAIRFGYETSPPPPPKTITVSGHGPYEIRLTAPAHPAPIVATVWTACNGRRACTPAASAAGLSFVFEPSRIAQFRRDPYGVYTIRAWLLDAAGNADPADGATLRIDHRRPGKQSPELRILSVRRTRRALDVRGAAARALAGNVEIVVRYLFVGRPRQIRRTAPVAHGRWAAALGLPEGALTARVMVVYHRSARWQGQTITRRIHHRAFVP